MLWFQKNQEHNKCCLYHKIKQRKCKVLKDWKKLQINGLNLLMRSRKNLSFKWREKISIGISKRWAVFNKMAFLTTPTAESKVLNSNSNKRKVNRNKLKFKMLIKKKYKMPEMMILWSSLLNQWVPMFSSWKRTWPILKNNKVFQQLKQWNSVLNNGLA
jgi:hypothetical protein